MLLMVENCIIGGICHSIYQYAKANSKYMRDYDKNKESSYLKYWHVNNLYGWAMSKKIPLNNFEWIEDTSQFKKISLKAITKKVMKNIFSKLMLNILKNYKNFIMIYYFYQIEQKLKKSKAYLHDKGEYVIHITNSKQG